MPQHILLNTTGLISRIHDLPLLKCLAFIALAYVEDAVPLLFILYLNLAYACPPYLPHPVEMFDDHHIMPCLRTTTNPGTAQELQIKVKRENCPAYQRPALRHCAVT
jgi:hypothetical protein